MNVTIQGFIKSEHLGRHATKHNPLKQWNSLTPILENWQVPTKRDKRWDTIPQARADLARKQDNASWCHLFPRANINLWTIWTAHCELRDYKFAHTQTPAFAWDWTRRGQISWVRACSKMSAVCRTEASLYAWFTFWKRKCSSYSVGNL